MAKYRTVYRIMLLVTSLSMLVIGLSACGKQSPVKEPPPSSVNPTADIASTPLTILSIAGGNVLVMKPGDIQWVSGEVGMTLGVDYKIKTETGGRATITFFEGSTVELEGDTEISLAELGMAGTAGKIRIKQDLGKTISRVKKLIDPASGFEIETAAAIASVRGTSLYVSVDRNGVTIVGNIEGLVSVVAQGIEVKLSEGTHTTVVPGQSPGQPEPDITPPAQSTPASLPATTPEPTPTPTPTPYTAKISISKTCDHQTAYPGDNITYTYRVSNEGDVPFSNVTVMDDKAGQAAYISGDDDSDGSLDKGETWIFNAVYTVKDGETGQLTNKAVASGTGPGNQAATAPATATVNVIDIIVKITSLTQDEIVGRTVTVSGTVNDPSITQAIMTVNDSPGNISVVNGQFTSTVELADGVNIITVTVTKAGGITRSASVRLEPESSR